MGPSVLGFRSTAFLRILVEVLRDFLEDIRIRLWNVNYAARHT